MRWVDDDEQFAYCSKLVMGLAQLRASIMQAETFQLAVWDGARQGASPAPRPIVPNGRARAANPVISVPPTARRLDAVAVNRDAHQPRWKLRSMLFADFAGFSRLDEDRLSQFLEVVMGRIARVLDRHAEAVLTATAGATPSMCVITSPERSRGNRAGNPVGARSGIAADAGLPPEGGMRISLHHGPIFEHFDAVRARGPSTAPKSPSRRGSSRGCRSARSTPPSHLRR
jgi:adenylate cyclase